jgi:hypothetical protein
MPGEIPVIPETFKGIGYTKDRNGLPLQCISASSGATARHAGWRPA